MCFSYPPVGRVSRVSLRSFFSSLLIASFLLSDARLGEAASLRPLAVPDLSALVSPQELSQTDVLVDDSRERLYVLGEFTHARGLPVSGMFRVNLNGVVDANWRPQSIPRLFNASLTSSGDIIGNAFGSPILVDGVYRQPLAARALRISAANGRVAAEYKVQPFMSGEASYFAQGVSTSDRWVYLTIAHQSFGSGTTNMQRTRIVRFDIDSQIIDPNWVLDMKASAALAAATNDSIYVATNAQVPPSPFTDVTRVQRISTQSGAGVPWNRAFSGTRIERIFVDSRSRLCVVAREGVVGPNELVLKRLTSDGALDPSWSGNRADGCRILRAHREPLLHHQSRL
jgi:Domain of unknown function (DUF5122) beta-propeller